MDIDKVLRGAASQITSSLSGEPVPNLGRTRRSGWVVGSLVAASAVIMIGSVNLVTGGGESVTTANPTSTSTTSIDVAPPVTSTTIARTDPVSIPALAVWNVQHPPTWDRVDNDLPLVTDRDYESMTLATFPIRTGDPHCPSIPTLALIDLGPTDAVVSVLFTDLTAERAGQWPLQGFGEQDFLVVVKGEGENALTCSERPDLEAYTGPSTPSGIVVTVAFGEDVTDELRTQTWGVVSSLRPQAGADRAPGPVCVVTAPPQPGLTPPGPWNPNPSDASTVWFGTPDLWTPLPIEGPYPPRKSVWWSQNFTDWSVEPRPEIAVVHERLDEPGLVFVGALPGTNASTTEDGLFMIADIDPVPAGCWRVTGTYKDSSLSYVVHRPITFRPGPSTATTTTTLLASPPTGPLFGDETGDVLVFDNGLSGVLALDPDGREASKAAIVGQQAGSQPYRSHRVGDHLVVGWGVIRSYSLITGESTQISVGTIFVPATEPDRVWIVDWANGGRIGTGVPSAWQVDMAGNVLTEPTKIEFDGWSFPAIGVPGGLAIQTDEGAVLWYPETGVSDQMFGESSGAVVDTSGDLLAYCTTDSCTEVAVVDLSTGVESLIATGAPGIHLGQFSPDGSMLALTAGTGDLLVVEVARPDSVAGAAKQFGGDESRFTVSWAPDGSALYAATYSYARSSLTILRYDIESQTSATAVLPFGGTIDFVVMTPAEAKLFFSDPFDF